MPAFSVTDGSVAEDPVEALNAEKIRTLEKYNEVLCGELERKKEEARDSLKRLQVCDGGWAVVMGRHSGRQWPPM